MVPASRRSASTSVMIAVLASALGTTVRAAGSEAEPLQEIMVTAGRVESKLQDTPIAISAFTDADITRFGFVSSTDLAAHTPSLTIGGDGQLGTTPIVLRGVGVVDPNGNTQDNPVAIYVDGVYLSRPYSNIFLLPDIARVEVLRGPQGTLFGRNSSAGAVQFVTRQPGDAYEASGVASYGNFNTYNMRGYVLAPLGNGWGVKFAAGAASTDGWAYNETQRERFAGGSSNIVRASLRFNDTETDFVLQADHSTSFDRSHFVNVALFPTQPTNVNTDNSPQGEQRYNSTVSATYERNVGFGKATLVASYVTSESDSDFDSDSSALDLVYLRDFVLTGKEYSLEARLASNPSTTWNWITGVYLFGENDRETGDVDLGSAITGGASAVLNRIDNDSKTRSGAVFAETTYSVTSRFDLTAGVRYTHDNKSIIGRNLELPQPVKLDTSQGWSNVSPRLIGKYAFTDYTMGYASISEGFRSGTWSLTTDNAIPAKPEYVWNYEMGVKSKFLDGRAKLNLAAFHEHIEGKQEQVVVAVGVTSERNATTANIDGLEAEFEFVPVDSFHVIANASFLHTKYGTFIGSPTDVGPGESYIYTGNRLPFAPKVKTSLIPAYTVPLTGHGDITLQAEWIHDSSVYFTRINDPREGNAGYNDYNVRLIWQATPQLSMSLYGENLSDERHTIQIQPFLNQGLGLPTQYNDPRRYGAQASFRF